MTSAGAVHVRHLFVGGRRVIDNGVLPGVDLARLRHDAARRLGGLTGDVLGALEQIGEILILLVAVAVAKA